MRQDLHLGLNVPRNGIRLDLIICENCLSSLRSFFFFKEHMHSVHSENLFLESENVNLAHQKDTPVQPALEGKSQRTKGHGPHSNTSSAEWRAACAVRED